MKKWIGPCLSLLLVVVLVYLSVPFHPAGQTAPMDGEGKEAQLLLAQQRKEEKKDDDSAFIQVLIGFQETLDGWLKSINERIDSEDVTRLEVRFLEILRNILEWVKERIDAQIDSSRGQKERREKGTFRETRQRSSPFSLEG